MEQVITTTHDAPAAACWDAIEPPAPIRDRSIFELLIRGDVREVNRRLLELPLAPQLQTLILLTVLGLAVHGVVVGAVARALDVSGLAGGGIWVLPVALPAAVLLSLAICLPSFFFYTQLSGLDASFKLVTAQALRAMASASAYVLGALPFYGAYALAYVVGIADATSWQAERVVVIGLFIPLIVGLHGVRVLYLSFRDLLSVVPITHARRGRFLLRMVVAWAAVFTAVAPLAVYRMVEFFLGGS